MRTCGWELEAWGPHPGCREFMAEPEVMTCTNVALVRVTVWDRWTEGWAAAEGGWEQFREMLVRAGADDPGTEEEAASQWLCVEHAREHVAWAEQQDAAEIRVTGLLLASPAVQQVLEEAVA